MRLARSRVTVQGQISVPAEVRRLLGLAPGSVLQWDSEGDQVIVRRAGQYSSEDLHRAIFPVEPARRGLDELKEGIRRHMRGKHARH